MLVLKRQTEQGIVMVLPDGEKITVRVIDRNGRAGRVTTVRLAIDAPAGVEIFRQEHFQNLKPSTNGERTWLKRESQASNGARPKRGM